MKSVPKIGLTTLFKENPGIAGDWYVRPHKYDLAVAEAGGLPVSIPAFADEEYEQVEQYLFDSPIEDGFVQDEESASEEFIPDFDNSGV